MWVTFWGVRGSYPVPGPSTVRYGGQTSCVELRAESGSRLIVDAGTGLRALGQHLQRERADAPTASYDLVLSHVHWDHIQGLPFFGPAYSRGTSIDVYAGKSATTELKQVITGITRHEFFPGTTRVGTGHFHSMKWCRRSASAFASSNFCSDSTIRLAQWAT